MFMHTLADPVDSRVVTNGGVVRVDKNNFEPFESGILAHPVRVEDTKVGSLPSCFFFCNRSKVSCGLQVVDTLVARLSVNDAFWVLAFSVSTAHS